MIKFRAWDKESKTIDTIRRITWNGGDITDVYLENIGLRRLDQVILMQSTGLKDKNYVEIYDGDIVVNHVGDAWAIAYFRGAFRYYPIESFSKEREKQFETDNIGNFGTEVFEVIGNIYENYELLEGLVK